MNAHKRKKRNTRGESMVVAIVLMLVFFVLGLAVLTGSSVANASVNARISYRQTYYYARSALEMLDESLRFGDLGQWVRDSERDALAAHNPSAGGALIESRTHLIPISFSAANAPEGLVFADGGATLSYDVVSQYLTGNEPMISLGNVRLSFRIVYAGRTYGASTVYSYRGFYDAQQGIWDEQWRLRSMS